MAFSAAILTKIGALVLRRKPLPARQSGPLGPVIGMRLSALVDEHSDLDIAIAALLEAGNCDDLLIKRLKKRKLQIKDDIASLTPWLGGAGPREMVSCVA
jgi:hypothetical protein